ncbi:MAG TPA: NmrA family NAD(P)-binding protein [Streptosporangiaceae bacterium]|jgi:uncharacterized protein YbjT (DUF2867 family)
MTENAKITLVLGGTGKTGRRIVHRLTTRGLPVRAGSRSGAPPFDWDEESTWTPTLRDVTAAYIVYYPDLVMPGAAPAIRKFAARAVASGVRRLVLLSGRGEEETYASEQAVRDSGAAWTILRAGWFAQNFSEDFLLDPVLSGEIALPAGDVPEPFVDAEDIADVAVAALTTDRHAGRIYELTGPRLLTFEDAAGEISKATGREVRYVPISPERYASVLAEHVPADHVAMLSNLFTRVMDGRNAHLTDGVERTLGRPPRDFGDYARVAATTGIWNR